MEIFNRKSNKRDQVNSLNRRFHCDICSNSYSRKDTLNLHKKKQHQETLHYCDECQNSFIRLTDLNRHKLTKHNKADTSDMNGQDEKLIGQPSVKLNDFYYCDINSLSSAQFSICDVCCKSCVSMSEWIDHMKMHYEPAKVKNNNCYYKEYPKLFGDVPLFDDGDFTCDMCDFMFLSLEDLLEHQKCHYEITSGNNNCICDLSFWYKQSQNKNNPNISRKSTVNNPLETHIKEETTSIQPYSSSADTQNDFAGHEGIQVLKKLFVGGQTFDCEFCQTICDNPDHLDMYRWTHGDNYGSEDVYECYVCSERFSDKVIMKMHENEHIQKMIF
ncbi:zinc finger protein 39-like [Adelges cooleyi]|uniref:zinc finger protein 39-like n=1 Tax=Adelges cooleyi TaxID=133065 RepID=UPI00217FF1F9|nr:zinc finger protein 39-like [Adelges cooleyi]